MTLDKKQLIEIAERYYPHHWDPDDPNEEKSQERKAYDDAWSRAPSFEQWFETVKAIRKDLPPGVEIHDATPGRGCGGFRCVSHVRDQPLAGGAELVTSVAGYRSILAPIYSLIWAQQILAPRRGMMMMRQCPWRDASVEIPEDLKSIADIIARHIERDSGYQRLPVELARVRVPTIRVNFIPFGEATVFDALIDSDPANVY